MAIDHVVVTFTTDSKQLAETMAAEATDAGFPCCAHIEGPIRSVYRWHGRKHADEQWRVEIEVSPDGAKSLLEHIKANHGTDVHDVVVTDNLTHIFDEATGS